MITSGGCRVVRSNGLEPSTPTMSRWCSNQLSYGRTLYSSLIILRVVPKVMLVRPNGLEPSTPTMSRWCSNQLSYGRTLYSSLIILRVVPKVMLVRPNGLEPSTPTMSRWCSNQLSYGRILYYLPSMLTAGTNINELPVCWQGEKHNIHRKLT